MYLTLRKCKNHCKILKITLVQIFHPLKPEIARFSIGFRLKLSAPISFAGYCWLAEQ